MIVSSFYYYYKVIQFYIFHIRRRTYAKFYVLMITQFQNYLTLRNINMHLITLIKATS